MSGSELSPFNLVLHQPVIPGNTGAIARLCACTGARLHLIHPLGFRVDEASVKRAGLDYWPHVDISNHASWDSFLESENPTRLFFFSKMAERSYAELKFLPPVYLVFGNETQGLPKSIWERYDRESFIQVPMRTNLVRSLNLAQCAAIVLYEALRQNSFPL
jgi:tRNA (cytidine/uridine-2'-O-)-methyltransferase